MIIHNKNISHIYHLSDIHFRNLKRHKEYRYVLTQFIERVIADNIKDAIIYIGGDIAHAKTEMSPELVREISWFLVECANLKPTILITGNHDCNVNNMSRLDVLTPIVNNINHPNIHYLRDTGVYHFGNTAFAVYSILDDRENWPTASSITADTKICLFHGPVYTAKTDIGYTVSSKSFTTKLFDGFDMALLGDIHSRQYIDRKTIVYSGSIIQQNHSETLNNHGYLLWNVSDRTYEEFDIANEYGFYTLDVVDGKMPIVTDMPKYPRLRVRISNTEPSQIKRVLAEIRKEYNIQEFTVTRMDTLNSQKSGTFSNKISIGNIRDVEFQNQLLSDYLEHHFLLDNTLIERIKDVNRQMNLKIVDSEINDGFMWRPKQFEFSNMFSYGGGNSIRFENISGIVGLFAPNTQGKSSIIDSLLFCMFDKSSRTFLAKNILNNQKETFECKFNFELDGVDYYIERKAKVVNKGKNVKVDVDFWKIDNDEIILLNGEDRRDTNKTIQEYLGTYEDFILTAISIQNNNALFIDKSQSDRKDILAQFLGVNIFDKLYQSALDENKNNSILLRKFKQDDFTNRLASLEKNIVHEQFNIDKLSADISKLKTEIYDINDTIIEYNSRLIPIKGDSTSIENLNNTLNTEVYTNDKILADIRTTHDKIVTLERLQIENEQSIDNYDEDIIFEKHIEYDNVTNEINSQALSKKTIEYEISALKSQLNHLNEHRYNPDCDICMDNSKLIINSKDTVEKDLLNKINALKITSEIQSQNEKRLSDLIKFNDDYIKLSELKKMQIKIESELNNLVSKVSLLDMELIISNDKLTKLRDNISDYYTNETQILINNDIKKKINEFTEHRSKLNTLLAKEEKNLLSVTSTISTLKSQRDTIEDKIKQIQKLEEENSLFEYYLNAMGREGISYELISKTLPAIEGEINNILSQIVEFGVMLSMDGKNINAHIVYDNQLWSLEMASGMERFITGLAIRVALINMCNLPRPNFLVIDEGMGALDTDSLSSLYLLFSYLKTQFDFVLVISHLDVVRDMVDTLVEIKKINGFSHIKV